MSANEEVWKKDPEPPRIGPMIAVALELAMLSVFAVEKSWVGLLLWIGYFYFSATWHMLIGRFDADEDED
jgi:hypothetical protein